MDPFTVLIISMIEEKLIILKLEIANWHSFFVRCRRIYILNDINNLVHTQRQII